MIDCGLQQGSNPTRSLRHKSNRSLCGSCYCESVQRMRPERLKQASLDRQLQCTDSEGFTVIVSELLPPLCSLDKLGVSELLTPLCSLDKLGVQSKLWKTLGKRRPAMQHRCHTFPFARLPHRVHVPVSLGHRAVNPSPSFGLCDAHPSKHRAGLLTFFRP